MAVRTGLLRGRVPRSPTTRPVGHCLHAVTDDYQTTYKLNGPYVAGNAYGNGQGQVMQMDIKTGHLTPVATSVGNPAALQGPHGMQFVAQ